MRLRLMSLLAAAVLAGCGSSGSVHHPRSVSLVLDFTPNAVHAGIYSALARGYTRQDDLDLHVLAPSASTDSIKLLDSGRVDFAILDIHDLAIARQRGAQLVGIMAIVERPLAAVIAQAAVTTPRQLAGKTVGITGVPSDSAVLDSILAGSGANPRRVKTLTIGFDAVPDLLAGRIAAATAFWNDEGVTLQRRRAGFHVFRVEDFRAPAYPELVLTTTAARLRAEPGVARGLVSALVRGYRFTLSDPQASARDLEARAAGLDHGLVSAELTMLLPAFRDRRGAIGALDADVLRAWAGWELRMGIVSARPNVAELFDRRLVTRVG